MKVFINSANKSEPRKIVEVKVLKERDTTFLVQLPDGKEVIRKKNRDIPLVEGKE